VYDGGLYGVTGLHLATAAPATMATSTGMHRHGLGQTLTVSGELHSPDGRPPGVSIGIVRTDGTPVYGVVSEADNYIPTAIDAHRFAFQLRLPDLPLLPGKYKVRAHALDPEGMRLFDTLERDLFVEGATRELGLCRLEHQWVGQEAER
jgi:lipopolysaccharide transport system ATP-binding protein